MPCSNESPPSAAEKSLQRLTSLRARTKRNTVICDVIFSRPNRTDAFNLAQSVDEYVRNEPYGSSHHLVRGTREKVKNELSCCRASTGDAATLLRDFGPGRAAVGPCPPGTTPRARTEFFYCYARTCQREQTTAWFRCPSGSRREHAPVNLTVSTGPEGPGTRRLRRCARARRLRDLLLGRSYAAAPPTRTLAVPWLILPVVICLSQRLSHACLSTSQIKVKPRKAH